MLRPEQLFRLGHGLTKQVFSLFQLASPSPLKLSQITEHNREALLTPLPALPPEIASARRYSSVAAVKCRLQAIR